MPLRVRYAAPEPGLQLGYSVERLSDGLWYDFATAGPTPGQFTATPTTSIAPLPPDATVPGRYTVTLTPTPVAQWADGNYCVTIHNASSTGNRTAMACLQATMRNGDDQPAPAAPAAGLPAGTSFTGTFTVNPTAQPSAAGK